MRIQRETLEISDGRRLYVYSEVEGTDVSVPQDQQAESLEPEEG